MTDLNRGILGIDISKAKFDVALMVAGKVKKTHVFENTPLLDCDRASHDQGRNQNGGNDDP